MHVEQSKLSLNVPRKADEECRQTLLGRGDLEASISNFFFFNGYFFFNLLKAAERWEACLGLLWAHLKIRARDDDLELKYLGTQHWIGAEGDGWVFCSGLHFWKSGYWMLLTFANLEVQVLFRSENTEVLCTAHPCGCTVFRSNAGVTGRFFFQEPIFKRLKKNFWRAKWQASQFSHRLLEGIPQLQ